MRGRKPKPTALKILLGNPGRHPIKRDNPGGQEGIPDPPENLTREALKFWPEISELLANMGILTFQDKLMLTALAETYAERQGAAKLLEEEGWYQKIKTTRCPKGTKLTRVHPAVKVLQDADRRLRAWLCECGMTPSARSRVKISGSDKNQTQDPAKKYLA